MVFEDNFTSNVVINKDIVSMQRLSRSKARAEAELIAKVRRDLGLDELDLSRGGNRTGQARFYP